MFNPYKELNVKSDATLKEIKAAYRKKAKYCHPDTDNGNEEKFDRLNQAYQILSNEEQRKNYDEHGTIREPSDKNKALEVIASLLNQLLQKEVPLHANYLTLMKDTLKNSLAEMHNEEIKVKNKITYYEKLMKKFKRKKLTEQNIFILILISKKESEKRILLKIEDAKKDTNAALEILKDYEFNPDAPIIQQFIVPGGTWNSTTT